MVVDDCSFPGVMAGCTVINFQSWSLDVLRSLTANALPAATLHLTQPGMHARVCDLMSQMHALALTAHSAFASRQRRSVAVSARTYESFIRKYDQSNSSCRAVRGNAHERMGE